MKDFSKLVLTPIIDKRGRHTHVYKKVISNFKKELLKKYRIDVVDGDDKVTKSLINDIENVIDIEKISKLNPQELIIVFKFRPLTVHGYKIMGIYEPESNVIFVNLKYRTGFNHEFGHFIFRTLTNYSNNEEVKNILNHFIPENFLDRKRDLHLRSVFKTYYGLNDVLKNGLPILTEISSALPDNLKEKLKGVDFPYVYLWKRVSGVIKGSEEYKSSFKVAVGDEVYNKTINFFNTLSENKRNLLDYTTEKVMKILPTFNDIKINSFFFYFNQNEPFARFFEQYISEKNPKSVGSKDPEEYKKNIDLYFTSKEMNELKIKFNKIINLI